MTLFAKLPTKSVKINEFGAAAPEESRSTKEDERSAALAARARLGDYDEGGNFPDSLRCNGR